MRSAVCIAFSRRDQQWRFRCRVLNRIESSKQTLSACLANDRRFVSAIVVVAVEPAVGVAIDAANTVGGHATIGERGEYTTLLVDCQIVEVEQVARPVGT